MAVLQQVWRIQACLLDEAIAKCINSFPLGRMSNVCKRYKVIGQEKPVQLLPKLAVSIPRGVPWYSGRGPPEGQGSGPGWTCPISLASVGKKPSPFGLKSHLSFSAESKAQSWSGSGSRSYIIIF